MTSNFEKAFNLILKKRFFLFLKYFYILLLVFAFLGIAIYQIMNLFEFFKSSNSLQKYLLFVAIETPIFLLLTIFTGISLLFLGKKSLIFLSFYSIIPICSTLSYFFLDVFSSNIYVKWNNVIIRSLVIYIPSLLCGWFYNFIMNLLNKKIEKINDDINSISNGSQP